MPNKLKTIEELKAEYREFLAKEKAENAKNDPKAVAAAWDAVKQQQIKAAENYNEYMHNIKNAPVGSNFPVVHSAAAAITESKKKEDLN